MNDSRLTYASRSERTTLPRTPRPARPCWVGRAGLGALGSHAHGHRPVLHGQADVESAERLAYRLLRTLRLPFDIDGMEVCVAASAGFAVALPGDDADTLLRQAKELR